jgi:sporulation protein YlmC with PRC-barrel domain
MMEEAMLTKHLALVVLSSTLMAAPVLAQTNQSSGAAAPAAGQMNSGNWMTQEQPGQWRASKLEGLDVYNNNDEKIGDISEVLVDNAGKIQAVVIGVGGFLGMGEHDVAVPFEQIKFVNEPRASTTAANTANNTGAAPAGTVATPANPNASANSNMATNNAAANNVNTTGTVGTGNRDAMNRSAPDHAMLNMTKDQLKAAPEFKYAR